MRTGVQDFSVGTQDYDGRVISRGTRKASAQFLRRQHRLSNAKLVSKENCREKFRVPRPEPKAMSRCLIVALILCGCAKPMTNDQVIAEYKKCKDAHAEVYVRMNFIGEYLEVTCRPKP
jgi:hypothetical protein